ncbi:Regulator_of chromosome condensation 1/beta-lactamase-inhibitor protein II [Hexamita inflata]|uniref:Regulator_of chromosome condensation 1/beta-lactamase-inhibitor protein II n=1 Tax=Hexamita inflata TaxID=28002 RepID=A0ABP1LWG8_9EUKA
MFFTMCFTQVKIASFNSVSGVSLAQASTDKVLDIVSCQSAMYQIAENGTILAKGSKKGLLDHTAFFSYLSLSINNVIQVICLKNKMGYVIKTGAAYLEGPLVQGKLTFVQIPSAPAGILKIVTNGDITFALTKAGIYAVGECRSYLCGTTAESDPVVYTLVPIAPVLPADIKTISLDKFLFIYMNNGDVYALGENEGGVLPAAAYPDLGVIRRVGNGIKNLQLGWNVSRAETSLYFLNGTALTVFNRNSTPQYRVVETEVFDFLVQESTHIIALKEQSVFVLAEVSTFSKETSYFCQANPLDAICIKVASGTFDEVIDCPASSTSEFCKVLKCEDSPADISCVVASCADANSTCWSIFCAKDADLAKATPKCYLNYAKATFAAQLENAKDYVFHNDMLLQVAYSTNPQKLAAGGAAGIAIAVCVAVFIIISAIVFVIYRKKHVSSNNFEASSNIMRPAK